MAGRNGANFEAWIRIADFQTAGTLTTEYDFSPLGESVNAAVNTTHVIIDLVSTDNRDSGLIVTFSDIDGNVVSRDVGNDLGVDLTTPGTKLGELS